MGSGFIAAYCGCGIGNNLRFDHLRGLFVCRIGQGDTAVTGATVSAGVSGVILATGFSVF